MEVNFKNLNCLVEGYTVLTKFDEGRTLKMPWFIMYFHLVWKLIEVVVYKLKAFDVLNVYIFAHTTYNVQSTVSLDMFRRSRQT